MATSVYCTAGSAGPPAIRGGEHQLQAAMLILNFEAGLEQTSGPRLSCFLLQTVRGNHPSPSKAWHCHAQRAHVCRCAGACLKLFPYACRQLAACPQLGVGASKSVAGTVRTTYQVAEHQTLCRLPTHMTCMSQISLSWIGLGMQLLDIDIIDLIHICTNEGVACCSPPDSGAGRGRHC